MSLDDNRPTWNLLQGTFKSYWDTVSILCVLYVIAFTPLQVAFMAPPLVETSLAQSATWGSDCVQGNVPCFNYWGFFVMDLFIDIFFTADIAITFRTAWIDNDPYSPMFKSEYYSCKSASCNYIKGMFLIDVISVFPFWMMELNPALSGSGTLLRVPRLLRLAKLTKLLRVLRASRVFDRWNKAITTTCTAQALIFFELTGVLLVSVHMMGCLWYLIADLQIGFDQNYQEKYGPAALTTSTTTPNITEPIPYKAPSEWWDGNTWPMRAQEYQQKSLAEMYMASIYFALMTITTVGYGDITPVVVSERITCFFCMIIGTLIFAFVLGQVALLLKLWTDRRNLFLEDMATLQTYLGTYAFPKAVRERAINFFYYTYNKNQYHSDMDLRRETLSHCSPFLQRSLAYAEMKHVLIGRSESKQTDECNNGHDHRPNTSLSYPKPLPFLSGASTILIKDLCAALKYEVHGPVEVVAFQGSPCSKMLTLDQGCICKWTNSYAGTSEPTLRSWQYVTQGAQFGIDSLLLSVDPFTLKANTAQNCLWVQSFQTITFCNFMCLMAEDFAKIMECHPKQSVRMRKSILRARMRMCFRSIVAMDQKILSAFLAQTPKDSDFSENSGSHVQELAKFDVGDKTDSLPGELLKRVVFLCNENADLKGIVTNMQQQLQDQRSKYDEQSVQQLQKMNQKDQEIKQQQESMEKHQQRMEKQQQRMEKQQQALAQQHKELLALLQSPQMRFASMISEGVLAEAEADSDDGEDST